MAGIGHGNIGSRADQLLGLLYFITPVCVQQHHFLSPNGVGLLQLRCMVEQLLNPLPYMWQFLWLFETNRHACLLEQQLANVAKCYPHVWRNITSCPSFILHWHWSDLKMLSIQDCLKSKFSNHLWRWSKVQIQMHISGVQVCLQPHLDFIRIQDKGFWWCSFHPTLECCHSEQI